jgi:hypothetical protein
MKNMSDVVVEESYRADICFQALVLVVLQNDGAMVNSAVFENSRGVPS